MRKPDPKIEGKILDMLEEKKHSVNDLIGELKLSKSTVYKHLDRLETEGKIKIVQHSPEREYITIKDRKRINIGAFKEHLSYLEGKHKGHYPLAMNYIKKVSQDNLIPLEFVKKLTEKLDKKNYEEVQRDLLETLRNTLTNAKRERNEKIIVVIYSIGDKFIKMALDESNLEYGEDLSHVIRNEAMNLIGDLEYGEEINKLFEWIRTGDEKTYNDTTSVYYAVNRLCNSYREIIREKIYDMLINSDEKVRERGRKLGDYCAGIL